MIFFDNSYIDQSFKSRFSRQVWQLKKILSIYLPKIFFYKYMSERGIEKRFILQNLKVSLRRKIKIKLITQNENAKNFQIKSSFDCQIDNKGGIVDNMGNVHTTARSYKNYLKENDLVIKDWSDGSQKRDSNLNTRAREEAIKTLSNHKYL